MKSWWRQRNSRERFVLSAGGLILLLLLLYVVLWQPLRADLRSLRASVAQQRSDLAWMLAAAAEVKALRKNASGAESGSGTGPGPSLLTLVDQTAKQAGLAKALKRLEPQQDNQLRVQLEQIGFDELLLWLGELARDHGVITVNVIVNRDTGSQTPSNGRVDARLILQRPVS